MIAGVGLDVVDLAGFREQAADPASSFLDGVFTAAERREAEARPGGDPVPHLAARYAAKEALVKAWSGSRFGAPPRLERADLREIEVLSDGYGRPAVQLHGAMAAAVGARRVFVSLSHDGVVVAAVVVLEG